MSYDPYACEADMLPSHLTAAVPPLDPGSPPLDGGSVSASTGSRVAVLWSFARPYRGTLLTGFVLALAVSAMTLTSPMVTKWVLDTLAVGGSLRDPILLLVGLLVVGAAVGWYQWVLLGRLAEDVVYDARERILRRYLGARVFALLERRPGELVTRVTSDTVLLNEAASSSIIGLINGVIVLVGSLVLMARLDIPLFLTSLGAVAVVGVAMAILMPKISQVEERAQAALGDLGADLEGTLRSIKTVKSSRAEGRRLASLLERVEASRHWSLRSVRIQAGAWSIAGAGIQAAVIMVIGVGAARVAVGEMTVATLVAFLLYVWGLMGPVSELTANLTTLHSGIAAAGRIMDIERMPAEDPAFALAIAPAARGPKVGKDSARTPPVPIASADRWAGTGSGPSMGPVLELRCVTARYAPEDPSAVEEVDLTVPRHGHVALVGPSGAGKTTLFNLLLRFLEPEAGELRLDGRAYADLDDDQVRAAFAYVEQETPVVPGTIGDNLRFSAREVTDERVDEVLRELHLAEKIASLPDGLDTPLTDTNVSGGQRQRLSLARALLADPPVLLLDEATAQVDGITEAAIQDAIAERARTAAVITIAHRLSTVLDADEIILLDGGRVAARGNHEQLLATSMLYRDLVEALRIETPDQLRLRE